MALDGIDLPEGWKSYGVVPFAEPEDIPDDERQVWLCEDVVQIQCPDDYYIDVGWYPRNLRVGRLPGAFHCVIVKGGTPESWDDPIVELITLRTADVQKWLITAVEMVKGFLQGGGLA